MIKQVSIRRPDGHVWIFRYQHGRDADVLEHMTTLAMNKDVDFDWYDHGCVAYEMGRRLADDLKAGTPR